MSIRLQLDVRHLSLWKRHLVNAYKIKAGICVIAGKTVWSMPVWSAPWVWGTTKRALYKSTFLPLWRNRNGILHLGQLAY